MSDPAAPQPQDPKPLSARVPEKIAKGVVATGFLSYFGPNEIVLDFLQFISRPAHLASRVVMTPAVTEQFLGVLRENLARYSSTFGAPAPLPKNPDERPRTAQEIYDELKIADDQLAGVYANACLVGHTPAEFAIDFITTFIPNAAVSSRIYIAAPRVHQLIETVSGILEKYHRQRQQPPGASPSPGPSPFPAPPN